MKTEWIPLKYPPDRGTVLKPIKDNGKETIFQTNGVIRYRRLIVKGEASWFSNSKRAATRRRQDGDGASPKAKPNLRTRPEWQPLKNPPAAVTSFTLMKVEAGRLIFKTGNDVFYRCELDTDGTEHWYSANKRGR